MHSLFQPKPIKISQKTGIPLHILPQKGLTAKQIERMQMINSSDLPRASTQPRSKDESKEDRKARKQAIREERKVHFTLNKTLQKHVMLSEFCFMNIFLKLTCFLCLEINGKNLLVPKD